MRYCASLRLSYFYPRPPGGGRRSSTSTTLHKSSDFYPRPPGGGRLKAIAFANGETLFLSTPSGWRATTEKKAQHSMLYISIHALRVEGDGFHFNHTRGQLLFLSTPSGWRATVGLVKRAHNVKISIHALRVEGDEIMRYAFRAQIIFLSTPSGWRATPYDTPFISIYFYFYPRPPGGGRHCSG